ncbi:MAG TPA: Omp28-related outer membrane protein, partial [Bacteroidales bacterium]|nr:Omp28-related outer membrane protein [Bacteroidales bacterium]
STYGDLISEEALEVNKTYTANFAYTLKPEWVAKHCSVVAFIYNVDTKEVIQVEEAPVIQSRK